MSLRERKPRIRKTTHRYKRKQPIPQATPEFAWDRQPGESQKAWQTFELYRTLGVNRSMRRVAEVVHKSLHTIAAWACAHNWVDRTREWELYENKRAQREEQEAVKEMRRIHAEAGATLLKRGFGRLAVINPKMISPRTLLRFVELGAKLEARARGPAEEIHKVEHGLSGDGTGVQWITIGDKKIEF